MINITKTYLPNIDIYKGYIDEIYSNGWITNYGPLVKRLEERLAKYLGVKNIILVANGTVALEIAYRTLDIDGEAITTPFSFVATTSSLVTNGIKPIFADIDSKTLNIDPLKLEKVISEETSAIVPVHIFGNACDIEAIDKIAKRYDLKVIYDAAHTFGIEYRGTSILNYGDISTLSFHATKLFHTIEGGALVIDDDDLVQKARYLINFGIEDRESIPELGTNAKMNEFEAAMGLSILDEIDDILQNRKEIYDRYIESLSGIVEFQKLHKDTTHNYAYFPILLRDHSEMFMVKEALNQNLIYPRRYFYPSLDTLSYIEPKQYLPNARDISSRILALPIYPLLSLEEQTKIIDIVLKVLKG